MSLIHVATANPCHQIHVAVFRWWARALGLARVTAMALLAAASCRHHAPLCDHLHAPSLVPWPVVSPPVHHTILAWCSAVEVVHARAATQQRRHSTRSPHCHDEGEWHFAPFFPFPLSPCPWSLDSGGPDSRLFKVNKRLNSTQQHWTALMSEAGPQTTSDRRGYTNTAV